MTTEPDDPPPLEGTRQRLVRPGILLKEVLSGERPLYFFAGNDLVSRTLRRDEGASISDLHKTYKDAIQREINALREASKRIKPMVYQTFARLMQKARYMGYLEIRERVPVTPGSPAENLLTIERDQEGRDRVVPAMRSMYVLTEKGREEEEVWDRISSAYEEFLKEGG